jgi:hypothetical protein
MEAGRSLLAGRAEKCTYNKVYSGPPSFLYSPGASVLRESPIPFVTTEVAQGVGREREGAAKIVSNRITGCVVVSMFANPFLSSTRETSIVLRRFGRLSQYSSIFAQDHKEHKVVLKQMVVCVAGCAFEIKTEESKNNARRFILT